MKAELKKTFNRPITKLFFIGIGGSSMSGLATMSLAEGFEVEGSDMVASAYTEKLEGLGLTIHIGHHYDNIPLDTDCVVYSAAIHDDNPDMKRAHDLGLPKIERADFLGLFSHLFEQTISVSGTHGKTTTSSMVASLLHHADLKPSLSIGGKLDEFGGNAIIDEKKYFVVEACEYVDSFLKTSHSIGIITNIEEDHLDYFTGGLAQIKESFHNFAKILPADGLLIAYGDSQNVRDVLNDLACPVVTYGIDEANDWHAKNISYDLLGKPEFDVYQGNDFYGHFYLNSPGEHNVLNVLSAIICGDFLKIPVSLAIETFKNFQGPKRRFEFRGEARGVKVYEDYAHHPTELQVVIDACLNYDHKKLWVVFQPHTYSRTYFFFDAFVDAFAKADYVILNDIYSDREGNDWNIYSEDLAAAIQAKYAVPTTTISAFGDIVDHLIRHLEPGDMVLVAGSQTINRVAFDLIDRLSVY